MRNFIIVMVVAGAFVALFAPPSSASWVSDHCFVDNAADTAISRTTARTYAEIADEEGYEWGGGCWNDNPRYSTLLRAWLIISVVRA